MPSLFATKCAAALGAAVLVASWSGCFDDPCCDSDADCADAARCYEGACRLACDDDVQCLSGQSCNVLGVCIGAEAREQYCPFEFKGRAPIGGFVPEPEPTVQPEPEPNPSPNPEPEPQTGCPDDYEPNNTPDQASLLPESGRAEICADDVDYFVLSVAGGETVDVTVTFDSPDVDIDIRLLDVALNEIDASTGIDDTETVTGSSPTTTSFYLEVVAFAGRIGAYTFAVEREQNPVMCEPDPFEPNEAPDEATSVQFDFIAGRICPVDTDVFWFEASGVGGQTLVEMRVAEPFDGNISYDFFDDFGNAQAGSVTISPVTLLVDHSVNSYLTLNEAGVSPAGQNYEISFTPYAVQCPDDFEPNDESPYLVFAPDVLEASLCGSEIDLYFPDWPEDQEEVRVRVEAPFATQLDMLVVLAERVGGPQEYEVVEEFGPGQEVAFATEGHTVTDFIIGVVRPGETGPDLEYTLIVE